MIIELNIDSVNKDESKKLPGAVSIDTQETIWGARDTINEGSAEDLPLFLGVDADDFRYDIENDIFYNHIGAVFDAFDLSSYNNDEIIIKRIITKCKEKYPDYDFIMKRGKFPLGYKHNTFKSEEDIVNPEYSFSTHVLYVSNYIEYLANASLNSSKSDSPKSLNKKTKEVR